MKVAASHRQLSVRCTPLGPDWLSAQMELLDQPPTDPALQKLYPALKTRRTDRRAYFAKALSSDLKENLLKLNEQYETKAYFASPQATSLWNYLRDSEKIFWSEPELILETLKLVDFSGKIPKVGFGYKSAGLKESDALAIRILKQRPKIFSWLLRHGLAHVLSQTQLKTYQQCSDLILLTTPNSERRHLFTLGQHAAHLWLSLTEQGLSAQPLSFSSLSCFSQLQQDQPSEIIHRHQQHFDNGLATLRQSFSTPKYEVPAWIFRIGYASPLPKEMGVDRLRAEDVMSISLTQQTMPMN